MKLLVLPADDHALSRMAWWVLLLEGQPCLDVVTEARDGHGVVEEFD